MIESPAITDTQNPVNALLVLLSVSLERTVVHPQSMPTPGQQEIDNLKTYLKNVLEYLAKNENKIQEFQEKVNNLETRSSNQFLNHETRLAKYSSPKFILEHM